MTIHRPPPRLWERACPGRNRRHPLRFKPETSFTGMKYGQEVPDHALESRVPNGSSTVSGNSSAPCPALPPSNATTNP
jgi:hypothetical protein